MRPRKLTLNGLLLWTLSRILDFDRQLSFLTRNLNTLLWRMWIHSNHCTLFYLPKTGSRVPTSWKPNHNGAVVTAFLRASIMSLWTRAAARETRSPAQRRFADPYTQFNRNVRIELFGTAKYFKLSPLRTPLELHGPPPHLPSPQVCFEHSTTDPVKLPYAACSWCEILKILSLQRRMQKQTYYRNTINPLCKWMAGCKIVVLTQARSLHRCKNHKY